MEVTTQELAIILAGLKVKLDCGHHCTIGHQFANSSSILKVAGKLKPNVTTVATKRR